MPVIWSADGPLLMAEGPVRAQVNSVLMQLPWNDWEIGPNEIEVLQRKDGTDWKLGEGASASVRPTPAAPLCL